MPSANINTSLDLNASYEEAKELIESTKTYKELRQDYERLSKRAGDSFEQKKQDVSQSLDKAKELQKRYQREIRTQFEQLLTLNTISGGRGSNTTRYIKAKLIQTLTLIQPKILELLQNNVIEAIGCDEQQTYTNQSLYIKVNTLDLFNLLKKDPDSDIGKVLYEKQSIQIQNNPFSFNRELYQRIQSGQPYSVDNGQNYKGASGQNLFDIQYVELNNIGEVGPWFKIDLNNRVNNINKVSSFVTDYYKTINVIDFTSIISNIMECITGCISIKANVGLTEAEDTSKFLLLIQRILGLCFDDNTKEIDVAGTSKVSELDDIDESFFEFTDIDLRNINTRITNIKNGVVQFEDCDNVILPVNFQNILDSLNNLNFVPDNDLASAADSITDTLTSNPEWEGFALQGNVEASVNFNFVKLLIHGLISSILSPKVLIPIYIMIKALGKNFIDKINSLVDFMKVFRKFAINFISQVGAIFIEQLFEIIKKDILILVQSILRDIAVERLGKKYAMVIKLIQILLIVARFVSDWRKCKSVIDEILSIIQIATNGIGFGGINNNLPLPLVFAAQILEGYSETRAFIGTIRECQKIGIPTGPLPSGAPNLNILQIFSQLKSQAKEDATNNKVQIAIPPLSITPAGLTIPKDAFGKKF